MGLVSELRRRNVIRVAIAYAVSAWLLIEVSATTFPMLRLPEWTATFVAVLLMIGFPVALIFAWAFELTPDGLKKEMEVDRSQSITHITGRKFDYIIIVTLVMALGFFAFDKFVLDPSRDAELVQTTTESVTEQMTESGNIETSEKSIAVLPFVNMSDDPGNEYFSDGMSEEILNLLAKVPEMRVTSRSSAFSFKGQNVDIPTIAAKLNVAHVLEGSVRKSGNQLRITAQLIEVATDVHLWSETYDRELKSVFAIQDEIAAAVVDALKITLLGKEPNADETNPEAYALYLQGRYFSHQGTQDSYAKAEKLLMQALAIDSGFAPVWTEVAFVYIEQAGHNFRPHDQGFELARNAAQQALAIDQEYARGFAILGQVETQFDWNFIAADQHFRRALALDSGDAEVLESAANLYTRLGRFDEAIDLYRESIALDPVSAFSYLSLGRLLYYAHRLDEAEVALRKALSLAPDTIRGQYFLGWVLLAQGDEHASLAAMEQENGDFYHLTGTAVVQHALGNAKESEAALKELIENRGVESSYQIALVYAHRGDINASFDWLQQAYDIRDSGLNKMFVDPLLANLHDDPRWEPFLDKMGLLH